MGQHGIKIGSLLRRQLSAGFQHIRCGAFLLIEIAMQPHIRHELGQDHFTLCLFLRPRFRALVTDHAVFIAFVLRIVFVVGLDMVDQRAVPVAKILPSLVVVGFPVESEVNAELGFVVPAPVISRLLPFRAAGFVQRFEKGVSTGKGHLLTLAQLVAFTPNNRHHRLHSRIKGWGQRLALLAFLHGCGDLCIHALLHKIVKVSVLLFKALFAQLIDKGNGFRKILHLFMVLHNQAALGVAQTLPVLLGKVDQRICLFGGRCAQHKRFVIQKPVNAVPFMRSLFLLLQELRHFRKTEAVTVMGSFRVPMTQYNDVGNGKGMSREVCRMVEIKASVNIFQRIPVSQRRGIHKVVIVPLHIQSHSPQTVKRFKTVAPCFVAVFELVNGKGVFRLLHHLFGCIPQLLKIFNGYGFNRGRVKLMERKDFITGGGHGQIGIVKLPAVKVFHIAVIQGVVIAVIAGLHIEVCTIVQTVGVFLFLLG